jgi:sugar/nucleoside kinase (ribokinase family)
MKICTLGDLLLGVVVRLERPLVGGDDVVAVTRTGAGGQAANVAAWAAELGAESAFVGRRGDDEAGRLVTSALEGYGVSVLGPAQGRNGVVVSFVELDGTRSMASDRGVAPELEAADLDPDWFEECEVLHLAGYSLLRSPIAEASIAAVEFARSAGARVSVDLSTSTAIEEYGPERFAALLRQIAPDVLFGTAAELAALGSFPAREWVLKRGAAGITIGVDGASRNLPAPNVALVDSTGAGDALAAGFLVGGPEAGLDAAARCVAKPGAMP